jgi:hypothetical protein
MAPIIPLRVKYLDTKTLDRYLYVKIFEVEREEVRMLRPFSPEEGRVREMEIRAAVARKARTLRDGAPPSAGTAGRPAIALAAALRRVADRLDARPAPGRSAPGVASQ